jgi:hypothetical protein
MSTKRDKLEDTSRHHVTHKATADINVARKLAPARIFGHSNIREVVVVDLCMGSLGKPKVAEDFPHVVHLLATLPSSNIFGFRGGKGHAVLTARIPRDSAVVKHNEVARMRSSRLHIGCPVRINPVPESVGKRVDMMVEDRLIASATQVAYNMQGHPCELAQDILLSSELRPSEIGHVIFTRYPRQSHCT